MKNPYGYHYTVRRWLPIPRALMASVYAEAAKQLEAHPEYDDPLYAIRVATEARRLDDSRARYMWRYFMERVGLWAGDDEGIVLLCFASAMAATGDF